MSPAERDISREELETSLLANLKPIEGIAVFYYAGVAGLIALFSLSFGIKGAIGVGCAKGISDLLLAAGVSIAVFGAATGVGCLLGFLFGIPRTLQRGSDAGSHQSKAGLGGEDSVGLPAHRFFISNTSLEDISDWLTKIIIGIGLVQF